jgi:hypothetical protein
MTATLANWSPLTDQVDASKQRDGEYISASFMMIAAGPPRLSAIGSAAAAGIGVAAGGASWALPIGLTQNFQLGQNSGFARFWEIGSDRSYFIRQRTVAQAGFGRVMYHGPSLLRMLYAFYYDDIPPTLIDQFQNVSPNFGPPPASGGGTIVNPHNVLVPPGYENIYLNLASDLFSQPCGLLLYMKDSNQATMGAVYLEETYIPSHSLATDAQGCVVQEQVSLQPERVVPVAVTSIALIQDD